PTPRPRRSTWSAPHDPGRHRRALCGLDRGSVRVVSSQLVDRAVVPPARRRDRLRRGATPYVLLAPTMLLLAIFLIYPLVNIVKFSLQQYNVSKPWDNGFIGLGNFERMLGDEL